MEDGFSCSYRINQIMQKPIVAQVQPNLVRAKEESEHSLRTIKKLGKKCIKEIKHRMNFYVGQVGWLLVGRM